MGYPISRDYLATQFVNYDKLILQPRFKTLTDSADAKVPIKQTVADAGKLLAVGADGNVTLQATTDATTIGKEPINGTALQAAIGALDCAEVGGGARQYIASIKQVDGVLAATAATLPTTIDGYGITDAVYRKQLGAASTNALIGIATLNENGKVPSSQLPAYVDDVLEYQQKDNFPETGESGKIYLDIDKNLSYRWSGSTYVEISPSLALGETNSTAYSGEKGKLLTDAFNKHETNTIVHIKTAERDAWNNKVDKAEGKGLSTNDYTTAEKTKLAGIAEGANAYTHPNSGVTAGTYRSVTVNAAGHITAGSNPTLAVSEGGTGKTTANAAANAFINALTTGSAAPQDADYFISQYAGGGTTNTEYIRRPVSTLWTYIKGKADSTYAAKSHGTHVPSICTTITDWNNATSNGWYMGNNASNAPTTGVWFYGQVIAHNTNYVRQIVYKFANDAYINGANCDRYERAKNNGTWGPWVNTSVKTAVPSGAKFTDTTYSAATQSAQGLMSAADKKKLDGIATGANAYSHPTTSGNKHIPSGGSSGQILRWSADGTAVWGSDNNTDTKVTQTVTTTNASYPLLLAPKGQTATATTISYFDSGVTLNPSTNTITANISGSATKATQDANGNVIPDTYAKKSLYNDTAINMGRRADSVVGENSSALGYNVTASGKNSHAEGNNTTAWGKASHIEGISSNILPSSITPESTFDEVHTKWNENMFSLAFGEHSHVEGRDCISFGKNSHAEGMWTFAVGCESHAEGFQTKASNDFSHAEGEQTEASGQSSHAEGLQTEASGTYSHAEGFQTEANGTYSHTEGAYTKASGQSSHAEGLQTEANGTYSHAEGFQTEANGTYSHAGGRGTIAGYEAQTAIGKYNNNKKENLFEVGNGKNDDNRSNALELSKTGDLTVNSVKASKFYDSTGNVLPTIHTSTSTPSASDGNNGDIWIVY